MDAAEAVAQVGVGAPQAVHGRGAEGHKQRLGGGRAGLREGLEAPCDQHGAAAAVLQLEGLGGLHTTYKAPL